MIIDKPNENQILPLRELWKEAFGDTDAFLDRFFSTAFSYNRCRCVTENGRLVSALYWFDCDYQGEKIAYFYAIATAKAHRGKGLCQALIKDTHEHLRSLGYAGAILCPASDKLFDFYEKLGYRNCTFISEFTCIALGEATDLKEISSQKYADLRRKYLPSGSVIQENESIAFLNTYSRFYSGDDFLLCAREENTSLFGVELLGNTSSAPKILSALGFQGGTFRTLGNDKPFTMIYPFKMIVMPKYFGHAFD